MKLVHPEHFFQIEFEEGTTNELIIEEATLMSEFIFELLQQVEGEDGRFVLSDNSDLLKIPYKIECVINPFAIDLNQKKVITKLYNLIKQEVICSEWTIQLGDIHSQFMEVMNEIQDHIEYALSFKEESEITSILKYMDVKLVETNGNLLEKIIYYSKLLKQLMGQDIMVLVNIQSYLKEDEIQLLLKHSAYEKIHFLFIENVDRGEVRQGIRKIIIDQDKCEIF